MYYEYVLFNRLEIIMNSFSVQYYLWKYVIKIGIERLYTYRVC